MRLTNFILAEITTGFDILNDLCKSREIFFSAYFFYLTPYIPISPACGGIFNMKWRGVHPALRPETQCRRKRFTLKGTKGERFVFSPPRSLSQNPGFVIASDRRGRGPAVGGNFVSSLFAMVFLRHLPRGRGFTLKG